MESLLTSQHPSTHFPHSSTHSSSSTQKGGYMGQRMGYAEHELFGQYNNRGVLPASPILDEREVILREIEKERVRAQIVLSEIANRRVLEGEIGKEGTLAGPAEISVKKLKPTKLNRRAKKKALMANPDASESKSEAVKPPEAGTCKHPSDSNIKAKEEEERNLEVTRLEEIAVGVDIIEPEVDVTTDAVLPEDDDKFAKGKWSCDLCQVIVIAVSALNEVLLGRKHKLKEASLETPPPRTNSSVGKFAAVSLSKESESLENMIRFGTVGPRVSQVKPVAGEDEIVQNGESKPCIKEKIAEPMNCDKHISEGEKSIFPNNVLVVTAESRMKLKKSVNTSDNGPETSLIQFGPMEHSPSEVKPVVENDNKEETVLVACPDANKSGSKWNAVPPTALKKMCEKKHKLNEDSFEAQSPGEHCGTGNFSCDTLLSKETELVVNLQLDNLKKEHSKTFRSVQKNSDPNMTKDVLRREKNRVGTFSDKVTNDKEKGRKHNGVVQNGDTGTCDHMKKIDEPVNRVKHLYEVGKFTYPHIKVKKQDGKTAGVDVIKLGASSIHHAISPKDGKIDARGGWNCTLCQVVAPNEHCMNEHLCGKKHLKHLKGRAGNGETVFHNQNEKMGVALNCVQHVSGGGKNITVENVNVCEKGSYNPVNESKVEKNEMGLEVTEQDVMNAQPVDTVEPGSDSTVDAYSLEDAIISKGEWSQTEMRSFLPDTFVLGETELLEHSKFDQLKTADIRVTEVKCGTQYEQEEEEIVFMANPDATISGLKLKAVITPAADTSKHPFDNILYKNPEVISTSELALNEDSYKMQSPGKNSSIGRIAPETVLKQTEALENLKPGNLKNDQETIHSGQMNGDPKKAKYSFWCELCQVGTWSEINMNGHDMGKKHLGRLKERAKKGETGESNLKEEINVPGNSVEHISENEKSILSRNIDVVLGEARLELQKPLVASGSEASPVQIRASDRRVSDVVPLTENVNEEETVFVVNPDATIFGSKSKTVTPSVEDMRRHPSDILYEKAEVIAVSKSVSNGALLKPQSPGKNSRIGKITDDTVLKKTELLECPKPDNLRRDEEKTNLSGQKNGDPKKTNYSFWCEMCQVGGLSKKVKDSHEKSKKHLRRLEVRVQNGGTWEGPVDTVDHVSDSRKRIASCHIEEVLAETRLDIHNPLEALDNGHKILPQIRVADLRVSEAMPVTNNGNEETNIFMANPDATISGSTDVSSSKPASPGKNSSFEKIAADSVLLEQTDLLEKMYSDNFKVDQEKTNQNAQKSGDPKKSTYSFWCELCQVGTLSEIVMNGHEKGKKHFRRLEERAQKGKTGAGSQKEKIEVPVNSAEHASESWKSIHASNIDVVLDEARLELRKPLNASDNGFETSPIQIRAADHRVSEVTSLTKYGNEEENYMFLDIPDATVFGSKLKAVILPVTDASVCPSDNIFLKKTKEWSCAICQVNFISESVVNEYLCEKKHKCGEGSLKPQSPDNNVSADTMLDKTEVLEIPKPGKYETDQTKRAQSVNENPDPKKTMYNFWCEMCQVGASSEIVMNDHERGKKHLKHLKGRAGNGETVLHNQHEKMEVPLDCVQHVSEDGTNIVVKNDNVCVKGSYKTVKENKTKKDERALEVTEQDVINAQCVDIVEPGFDLTDALLPEDEVIAKGERRETEMRSLLGDTFVLKETELLEYSKPDQLKTIRIVQKNDHPKRTRGRFRRKKCQVGTMLEKNIDDHAEETVQNAEIGLYIEKEKIVEPVNCGGKSKCSKNVDLVSTEARIELPKPLDSDENGVETFLMQVGTIDLRVSEKEKKKEKIVEPVNCDKHRPGNDYIMNDAIVTMLEQSKSDDTINTAKSLNSVEKIGDLMKTNCSYWSEGREVGPSEKLAYNHEKGKESAEIDEREPCNAKEKMVLSVDCAAHVSKREKIIFSEILGQATVTNETSLWQMYIDH